MNTNRPVNNNNNYVPTRRDATGVTYGGAGEPMVIGQVDWSQKDCYYCGKKGHGQLECRMRKAQGAPLVRAPMRTRRMDANVSAASGSGGFDLRGVSSQGLDFLARAVEQARAMGTPPAQAHSQGFRRNRK